MTVSIAERLQRLNRVPQYEQRYVRIVRSDRVTGRFPRNVNEEPLTHQHRVKNAELQHGTR